MPDDLLMPESCLLALAKYGESLLSATQVHEFLEPWYGVNKYSSEIFECLHQASSQYDVPSTKAERNVALQAARASKKAKGMDDPEKAKAVRITDLRDQWLIRRNKITPALKAKMKKMKAAEAKEKAKQDKNEEKSQLNSIRRLALSNSQIGTFRDVLSDPPDIPEGPTRFAGLMHSANHQKAAKKQAAASKRASTMAKNRLNQISEANDAIEATESIKATKGTKRSARPQTPPPVQMELIRPGSKRRVRLTSNAVENTPKRMRIVDSGAAGPGSIEQANSLQ